MSNVSYRCAAFALPLVLCGCNSRSLDCSGDAAKNLVTGLFNQYYEKQGLGMYVEISKTTYDFDGIITRDKQSRTATCEASIKPNFAFRTDEKNPQSAQTMKMIFAMSGLNMNARRVQYELQITDDNRLFVTGKFLD